MTFLKSSWAPVGIPLLPTPPPAKKQLLSHPAPTPQHRAHVVKELLPSVQALLPGQVLGTASPFPWGMTDTIRQAGGALATPHADLLPHPGPTPDQLEERRVLGPTQDQAGRGGVTLQINMETVAILPVTKKL